MKKINLTVALIFGFASITFGKSINTYSVKENPETKTETSVETGSSGAIQSGSGDAPVGLG